MEEATIIAAIREAVPDKKACAIKRGHDRRGEGDLCRLISPKDPHWDALPGYFNEAFVAGTQPAQNRLQWVVAALRGPAEGGVVAGVSSPEVGLQHAV